MVVGATAATQVVSERVRRTAQRSHQGAARIAKEVHRPLVGTAADLRDHLAHRIETTPQSDDAIDPGEPLEQPHIGLICDDIDRRIGKPPMQRPHGGRGEDDIAQLARSRIARSARLTS